MKFLRTLARWLGLGMAPEILPETVVLRTPEVTAWRVPSAVRPMFFSETSDGKTLRSSPEMANPTPIRRWCLVEGEHRLSVCASLEDRRPGPRSTIAIAPYWNVSQGQICLGSMVTPRSAAAASLGAWVEGFFQSEFTHAGDVKITSHHEGHFGLWRELAGRQAFPVEWLIPGERWRSGCVAEADRCAPGEWRNRRIVITIVGCGGTGSQIATGMPYLHQALLASGHP